MELNFVDKFVNWCKSVGLQLCEAKTVMTYILNEGFIEIVARSMAQRSTWGRYEVVLPNR